MRFLSFRGSVRFVLFFVCGARRVCSARLCVAKGTECGRTLATDSIRDAPSRVAYSAHTFSGREREREQVSVQGCPGQSRPGVEKPCLAAGAGKGRSGREQEAAAALGKNCCRMRAQHNAEGYIYLMRPTRNKEPPPEQQQQKAGSVSESIKFMARGS